MKANEVLQLLNISRPTLTKYVKNGFIKKIDLPTGRYDYDKKSVYNFLNKNYKRKTVIYARVSTNKQKPDLNNQIELLKNYCFNKSYQVSNVYFDIASGISFDNRTALFEMIDEVIENKIEKIIITYKDRLSRIGFELFKTLFAKFGTEIEVISEVGSKKIDSEEIFEEIVSLLHCYSMKLYSSRRKKEIFNICQPLPE